jgi:rhodanese-related sulfurtransferase
MMMSKVEDVSRDELKQGLAAGTITLVDVREPYEYEDGHIPGASLNALQSFDPGALPPAAPGKRIVLACRAGARSLKALQLAQAAGRTDITAHYPGGFKDWAEAGEDVEA